MNTRREVQKIVVKVVFFANRTTQVDIRDGVRIFGEKKDLSGAKCEISFVEILNKGVKLDVPLRMCSQGHRVEFELELKVGNKIIRLPAQGIVDATETFVNSHDSIAVRFSRYDDTVWSLILGLYRERQTAAMDLFNTLKGGG